jgi:ribulose 1,5-bisphosphate synthetase/thiazole synthase
LEAHFIASSNKLHNDFISCSYKEKLTVEIAALQKQKILFITSNKPIQLANDNKENIEKFDLIVVGSGSGLDVANAIFKHGLRVAIIEKGATGGTQNF